MFQFRLPVFQQERLQRQATAANVATAEAQIEFPQRRHLQHSQPPLGLGFGRRKLEYMAGEFRRWNRILAGICHLAVGNHHLSDARFQVQVQKDPALFGLVQLKPAAAGGQLKPSCCFANAVAPVLQGFALDVHLERRVRGRRIDQTQACRSDLLGVK
jgi:hypothetical protein